MNILLLVLLLEGIFGIPDIPEHHFEKRVLYSKQSDENENNTLADISAKIIFVKLHVGPFSFKKRKVKGGMINFTCNGCLGVIVLIVVLIPLNFSYSSFSRIVCIILVCLQILCI